MKTIVAKDGKVLDGQKENWKKLIDIHAKDIADAHEECKKLFDGYTTEQRDEPDFAKEAIDFMMDFARLYTDNEITLEDYESAATLSKCVEKRMEEHLKREE